jgi:sec-independent protein translocase protein TatC
MTRKERDRREMSFFDHVEELRTRIIRCVVYVAAASVAGWVWREPLLEFIRRPAEVGARAVGVERLPFRVFEPLGGFMIAIQVALVAGIVLASPLILWEIWAFVEPALEDHERKYAVLIVPSAVVLFLGGVVFCYYVSPRAFAFLFSIDKSLGVDIERTLQPYLWFILRLMLGFGLAFELPLVLMFLAALGLVNARQLLAWWRQAVVVIFIFAAIVTPTVDPVNMTILAAPMMALYMLSILLVRFVQRPRTEEGAGEEEAEETSDPSVAVYEEARAAAQEVGEEDIPIPPPPQQADLGEEGPEPRREGEDRDDGRPPSP